MKDFLKVMISRFKSPVVWAGIIAIVGLVFSTVGVTFADVMTWQGLKEVLVGIITSPAKIAMIVVAVYGFINNPADNAHF